MLKSADFGAEKVIKNKGFESSRGAKIKRRHERKKGPHRTQWGAKLAANKQQETKKGGEEMSSITTKW